MSRPAHVGESELMFWRSTPDGHYLTKSWTQFMVLADELFEHMVHELPIQDWTRREDGRLTTMTLRTLNGWATYRRVGRVPDQKCLVFELVESEYTPWQA